MPSSPIPVDLRPIGPKETAHRLLPILVPILVLAGQQAPCGKAVIRSPGTAPRGCSGLEVGVMVGEPRRDGGPSSASGQTPPCFPGLGPGIPRVRNRQKHGQEDPSTQDEPVPTAAHTPYQPKGFRRRTSVLRQGKSSVSTCWVVALYMPCRQKGQLERAHGTPNFPVENLSSDLNNQADT